MMNRRHPIPRAAPARGILSLTLAGWVMAGAAVRAQPATPWDIARTVRPDVSVSPDQDGPPVAPRIPPGGGFGAVMGPGAGLRTPGGTASAALPPSRLPPPDQSLADLNPLAVTVTMLKAVRERPLFTPSRRPPRAAPPPVTVEATVLPPPAAPNVRLIGIVQDAERAAGLVSRGTGPTLTVRAGDPVDGWEVGEIGPEHMTLRLGDQSQTYRIFADGPAAGTPAGSPRPRIVR